MRIRGMLVSAQIGLSLTLLVGVSLAVGTYRGIVDRDPGFRADGVLTTTIELPRGVEDARASEQYRALMERIHSVPGVTEAGAVPALPLEGGRWTASFEVLALSEDTDGAPWAAMRAAMPGYFETMRIPLQAGRSFEVTDDAGAAPVVGVDETVARTYWPGRSAVGRQVRVGGLSAGTATVIGVVGKVPAERFDQPELGHVYMPLLQSPQRRTLLVTRRSGDALAAAGAVRQTVREVAPRIAIAGISTMEGRASETLAGPRLSLRVPGIFGAVAIVLAAVGVYGVLAYSVARRTREIGTRMALGAAPGTVRGAIVGQALRSDRGEPAGHRRPVPAPVAQPSALVSSTSSTSKISVASPGMAPCRPGQP